MQTRLKIKRIVALLLPVVLMIIMFMTFPYEISAADVTLTTNTGPGLQAEINKAGTTPTTIIISANFSLNQIVQIPANANITIKSNQGLGGAPFTLTQTAERHFLVTGNLTLEDIILDGSSNSTSINSSGGVTVSSLSSSLTMNNGAVIRNCYLGTSGAGVLMSGGKFTMNGGTITGNTAGSGGGGVLMGSANCTFTMNGGAITGNTAKGSTNAGSGVFARGNFYMYGGEISDNIATGSSASGCGVLVYENGTFIMGNPGGTGNPTISGNKSPINGGGVYVHTGTFTMHSGEIKDNSAINGGGIYATANSNPTTIAGGTISDNKVTANGGGIYGINITISGANTEINGNKADQGNGGGVYELGSLTMDGGTISNNQAINVSGSGVGRGGGVYMAANDATLQMKNGADIIHNKSVGNTGGGIYTGGNCTIAMDDSSKISENETTALGTNICNGGGIFGAGDITITGGTISRNAARHHGGGVYGSGSVTVTNSVVCGNTATVYGGGVYVRNNITLNNTKIIKDENGKPNTSDSGGGIFMYYTDYTLEMKNSSEISGNLALGGGGVETGSVKGPNGWNTTIKLDDTSKINDNIADYGGGLDSAASVTITGGTISGNRANENGGGILGSGEVNISGGTQIIDNEAVNGGGIYINSNNEAMSVSGDVKISGNQASGNGGGICVNKNNKSITVSSGTISGNTSKYGGGVFLDGSSFVMGVAGGSNDSVKIMNNIASYMGGGVDVHNSSTFTMNCGTISDNKSVSGTSLTYGGGVEVYGSSTFTMKNGLITGNQSTEESGGVEVYDGSTFTMDGGSITNNSSASGGGVGVGYQLSKFNMSGGTISGNTTSFGGGGVYLHNSGSMTATSGMITNNTGSYGGGIFTNSTAKVFLDNCSITNNTATSDGGGIYTVERTYSNLKTGPGTDFGSNTAEMSYVPPGDLDALYPDIQYDAVTNPFTHPLNNYDINTIFSAAPICHITFDSRGGSAVVDQKKSFGDTVDKPADPTKNGYTFQGWFSKNENDELVPWDFDTVLDPDIHGAELILYAKWDAQEVTVNGTVRGLPDNSGVTITYSADGGHTTASTTTGSSGNYSISALYDSTLIITPSARAGYSVDPISRNITVTTEYLTGNDFTYMLGGYMVMFESNGGSSVSPQKASYKEKLTKPTAPTKQGFKFAGWYSDDGTFKNKWDFNTDTVTGNLTLYAKWKKISDLPEPSTPETGNHDNLVLWVCMLFISFVMTGYMFWIVLRKNKSNNHTM